MLATACPNGKVWLTKPRSPWGEERPLVRERTSDCDNGDGTTRFLRFCISMLSRVLPVHRRQRNNNWTRQNRGSHLFILFRKVISPPFLILCFKHARVNETQSKYDYRDLSSRCHTDQLLWPFLAFLSVAKITGRCRDVILAVWGHALVAVAVVKRFKQESMYGLFMWGSR